jgi:Subtilisin inhibitor-like
MARVLALALVLFAVAVRFGFGSVSTSPPTRLSISVYPHGRAAAEVRWYQLRCQPAAGTVADPVRACRTLVRLARPFAPVPAGTVCTQIALGPQEAIVTGVAKGRRIWARLRLGNGCEIARWRRLAAVVPGFGPAA